MKSFNAGGNIPLNLTSAFKIPIFYINTDFWKEISWFLPFVDSNENRAPNVPIFIKMSQKNLVKESGILELIIIIIGFPSGKDRSPVRHLNIISKLTTPVLK